MINVLIDHSYADDYFMISEITVNMEDKKEKERIKELAKELEGQLVDVDNGLRKRIADFLQVNPKLIDYDTNEIDIY